MAVTISGMFGSGKTYFADSPVVINISGLEWPGSSPFNIVEVDVIYDSKTVGKFRVDTGGQTSISLDISSALKAIWSGYDYTKEVGKANDAKASAGTSGFTPSDGDGFVNGYRSYRSYSLIVYTEYLDSQDGQFKRTASPVITGGQCAIGWLTEWERKKIMDEHNDDTAYADVSCLENTNTRNGDASNKPRTSPERVGSESITSWVDVSSAGTKSVFWPKGATPAADGTSEHAPIVLRDSMPYTDFLFVNRRGAVETCSGQMKEAMGIDVETQHYARSEHPSFKPVRSLMAIAKGGRRSWQMSSGHQTREWAEWWTEEFLMARQWWMLWKGPGQDTASYVPVIVEPAKKQTSVYDKSKQQMPSVEFTVTLALEG